VKTCCALFPLDATDARRFARASRSTASSPAERRRASKSPSGGVEPPLLIATRALSTVPRVAKHLSFKHFAAVPPFIRALASIMQPAETHETHPRSLIPLQAKLRDQRRQHIHDDPADRGARVAHRRPRPRHVDRDRIAPALAVSGRHIVFFNAAQQRPLNVRSRSWLD
jgi:hypothetical protein